MLKTHPQKFWNMLKQNSNDDKGIPLHRFADFNKQQFYNSEIPPDEYKPIEDPVTEYISQEELKEVL
jgi:hypothetical protein